MFLLFGERICQIKGIHALLVRHHDIDIIRHPFCDEMMSADRLQPPDFIFVGKGHSVHLIGAVFFEQFSQANHALSRGMNIWQQEACHIFLADAAGNLPISL